MLAGDRGRRPTAHALAAALTALLALAGLALAPSRAQAIGITNVTAAPSDTRAGAHSDFTLSFDVSDASDDLRDLTVDLPTGLLGNPMAAPQCTESQLNADGCPADSAVGSTTTSVTASLLGIPIPLDVSGTVYNVQPPSDQPARLGIVLRPAGGIVGKIYIIVRIRVRDEDDYGLQTIINDLPRSQAGLPITIRRLSLTLNGRVAGNRAFMVNPTTCSRATTKITATSYASSKPVTASGSFTPTDCEGEPFQPGMQIGIDQPTPDTITPHSIGLTQPEDVGGRAVSHVKKAVVRLPEGTTLNPSLAPTLELCSDSEFGPQGDPNVKCPEASLIGHVAFDNPLLGTVPGDVYFGRSDDDPYRLLIIGRKAGVTVKIRASVQPDDDTGQITTVFDDLPQVPFTKFNLTFKGGPRGVVVTPPACGTYTGSITATPYSGGPPQTPTASFDISDDGHGGCAPKETPTISGDVTTHKAMDSPTLTLDIGRDEASRRPSKLDVALPAGLVGDITAVPACPTSRASKGTCPSSSRIGSVVTTVGSGPLPITLHGTVYLGTGTSTSVARIWLDIPVKVGPIDLGTFTLANPLTLGSTDARVHVNASLPKAFKGFPLGLRRLQMTIDRKDFLINPSGCDARAFDVAMTAVDGTQGAGSGPFQARACDELKFRPVVATSIEDPGVKAEGGQPPLLTEIAKPRGDAALQDVDVLVSAMLQANPATLSDGICQPDQLAADACPPQTKVGVAEATTPVLHDKLTGPVYLTNIGTPAPDEPGVELPYATVMLKGPGVSLRLDGVLRLSPNAGRTEAHFSALPDVPLTDFKLSFYGGRPGYVGPFTNAGDLCSAAFGPSDARVISQAGQQSMQKPVLDAAACRQGALVHGDFSGLGSATPRGVVRVKREPHRPKKLRRVTIVAPDGLRARPDRARHGIVVRVDYKRLSVKHWSLTRSGKLIVRVPGKSGAERVTATFAKGVLVPTDGVRRKARERMSDLSGARPVELKLSTYTTEVGGRRAKTTVTVDGRP